MRNKKAKRATIIVLLVLVTLLTGIKVAHIMTIERPLKYSKIVSVYHLTVDSKNVQNEQAWTFEENSKPYMEIANAFEHTYFITDYIGGSSDGDASHELTVTFGKVTDGMPEIHVTVSENGYLQINGKRAYPLSFKYAGNGLYKHILECLPAENNNLH